VVELLDPAVGTDYQGDYDNKALTLKERQASISLIGARSGETGTTGELIAG
jgi:hypothetical protein